MLCLSLQEKNSAQKDPALLKSNFTDSTCAVKLKRDLLHFEFPRIWCPDDKISGARESQLEKQGRGHRLEPSSSCRERQAGCECVGSRLCTQGRPLEW